MEEKTEVIVIGAGPAGSCAADEIASAGHDVVLIEKASYAGETNVCGGITPVENADAFEIPSYVREKTVPNWVCYFPSETFSFELPFVSFRRSVFDKFLAERAASRGARMITKTLAKDVTIENDYAVVKLYDKEKNFDYEMKSQIVIFADGPGTLAARKFQGVGFQRRPERTFEGLLYELEMNDNSLDSLNMYFDKQIAPWGYGWLYPKGNVINAGICGLMSITSEEGGPRMRARLDYFVKEQKDAIKVTGDRRIVNFQGAIIPVEPAKKMYADRVMTVGDAAGMVEPYTAGGNEFAMRGGKLAGKIAVKAIQKRKYNEKFLSKYQDEWEKSKDAKTLDDMQKGLRYGLYMREKQNMDPIQAYLYFFHKLAEEAGQQIVPISRSS